MIKKRVKTAGPAPRTAAATEPGAAADVLPEAAATVRFYCGSITAGVTASDVRGRFAPFGDVLAVEMVPGKAPGAQAQQFSSEDRCVKSNAVLFIISRALFVS